MKKWKEDVWAKCMGNYSEHYPVPCILIGTKSDLSVERVVQQDEIDEYIKFNGHIKYFEVRLEFLFLSHSCKLQDLHKCR